MWIKLYRDVGVQGASSVTAVSSLSASECKSERERGKEERVRESFTLSLSLAQSAPGAAHGANAGLAELWG